MMLFHTFCGFILPKLAKTEKSGSFSRRLLLMAICTKNDPFFSFFANFGQINPQNVLNNISFICLCKNFEQKFLVPWDTPGVPGVSISGSPQSRILPISNSGYLGSIWILCTSGASDSSQKSETNWGLVCCRKQM